MWPTAAICLDLRSRRPDVRFVPQSLAQTARHLAAATVVSSWCSCGDRGPEPLTSLGGHKAGDDRLGREWHAFWILPWQHLLPLRFSVCTPLFSRGDCPLPGCVAQAERHLPPTGSCRLGLSAESSLVPCRSDSEMKGEKEMALGLLWDILPPPKQK